ncbi:hypothetical protein AX16_007365 [Volvariella volvacea WC 439]|nr:hypothetical protein AX16_007365 [Volvariella volvacea WC 439]
MECRNCEVKKRQFVCDNCLRRHVRDYRSQIQHFSHDRDEQVAKAVKGLQVVEEPRLNRAHIASYHHRMEEIMVGLAKVRKENDKKRERSRLLRESLANRRRTLSAAKLAHAPILIVMARERQELGTLSATIAHARSELVRELVDVFSLVPGGKTQGEWTIGNLVLPVPGDIKRYPPDHINAVITHTIHFISLLTFYLGVKLPFEVTWTGNKLGVGKPTIGAIKGGEHGGWSKWHHKHPLYLSSASAPAPSQSPTTSARSSKLDDPRTRRASLPPMPVQESFIETDTSPPSPSFTTAYAMLLYNVCYLAFTQNIDIPLNHAGDALKNLWTICFHAELGRRSHETLPPLPPPTPSNFSLDFGQLLQATMAGPVSRHRSTRPIGTPAKPVSRNTLNIPANTKEETILELDEDGWDIVDDEDDNVL